jgi:hypothetical protein
VRTKAFGKPHQPAGRASGPFRNFRPHIVPKISLTSAAPGKPLALRLPVSLQATARVSPGRQKSEQRDLAPRRRPRDQRLDAQPSCFVPARQPGMNPARVRRHRLASISQVADLPQPWQRAMALPLTFTASSEAGLSRSRVRRRLNRYRRSSDALRRRRFAYSASHCARRRVCPPRLVSTQPAPAGTTPIGQVSANTLGQRHVARTAKLCQFVIVASPPFGL